MPKRIEINMLHSDKKKKKVPLSAARRAPSLGLAVVFAVCLRCLPCQVYSFHHPGISARDLSSTRAMAIPRRALVQLVS